MNNERREKSRGNSEECRVKDSERVEEGKRREEEVRESSEQQQKTIESTD